MPIVGSVQVVSRSANVTLRQVNGTFVAPDSATVTLGNLTPPGTTGNRLDSLVDVSEVSPANNSTLVYHTANDTYVVQVLDLDGGTF